MKHTRKKRDYTVLSVTKPSRSIQLHSVATTTTQKEGKSDTLHPVRREREAHTTHAFLHNVGTLARRSRDGKKEAGR